MSEQDRGVSSAVSPAQIVAEHWHQAALKKGWTEAGHALAMVLMAFDGETDPLHLGIEEYSDAAKRLTSHVRAGAVLDPDDLRMPDATEEEADDMAGEAVWRCPKCNGTGFIVSTQGARKCISCKVEMQFMVALCDLCELPLSDHGKDGCHDARAVNRATDVALSESNDHRDEKKATSAGKTDGAWYVPCREGKHVQCPQGHIDGHADCACPCHIGYDLGHRAGYGIGRYDEKHGQDDLYWLSRPAPESTDDARTVKIEVDLDPTVEWFVRGDTRPAKDPETGYSTRSDLRWLTPAENAIRAATEVVEEAGASVTLTQAVVLLGQARDKVADHYEGLSPEEPAVDAGVDVETFGPGTWLHVGSDGSIEAHTPLCTECSNVVAASPSEDGPFKGPEPCKHEQLSPSQEIAAWCSCGKLVPVTGKDEYMTGGGTTTNVYLADPRALLKLLGFEWNPVGREVIAEAYERLAASDSAPADPYEALYTAADERADRWYNALIRLLAAINRDKSHGEFQGPETDFAVDVVRASLPGTTKDGVG